MSDIPRPPRKGQDPPAARHLRLVQPSPKVLENRRKYERTPTFTPEEQARLKAALRSTRLIFGTYRCAADAMRIPTNTLHEALGRNGVSADLAIRLARALGKPLESLYCAPTDASTCPTCGARRGP